MDFNVKKFASDAGVFFTRAVQFTGEKLGQSEKTELDAHFENLLSRADSTKNWTEKIFRQTEVLLQPNPIDHTGARIEEFLYEKLDRTVPSRPNNGELLGQYMQDAAKDFGVGTPYGSTLMHVGDCERRLGSAHREFLQTSAISFLTPLRNFLEGDWRTISKERRLLENRRLDLDSCKARLKKAKLAESKAACEGEAVPDFQETRPRNYVLSASASALWSEEVDKAEHELRVAQTEFDRQAEVTRLLLEGISSTHVNHLRCLHEFVEAQTAYYKQCHLHMQDLKKELDRFPNAFAGKPGHSMASDGSSSPGKAVDPLDVASTVETDTLKIEEVQAPATGTRKAKVLYDYDAADTSELSLLADELITVYTVPGMDSDWLVGERGNQKGKVPVTYLELLS
ncbi:endophilin-B2a isoform X4 [Esox lucius]|uniref:endophilin-B2a isoform X4 n=1 Tax=Esox lucius TaxID=8010 RepID=UPI001476CFD1|nr:endophilin-B2a isoform X4 [Esox lucius]